MGPGWRSSNHACTPPCPGWRPAGQSAAPAAAAAAPAAGSSTTGLPGVTGGQREAGRVKTADSVLTLKANCTGGGGRGLDGTQLRPQQAGLRLAHPQEEQRGGVALARRQQGPALRQGAVPDAVTPNLRGHQGELAVLNS